MFDFIIPGLEQGTLSRVLWLVSSSMVSDYSSVIALYRISMTKTGFNRLDYCSLGLDDDQESK